MLNNLDALDARARFPFSMVKSFKEPETFSVLVADDSDADRALLRDALRNHPRLTLVAEACDGDEVIHYLAQTRSFPESGRYRVPDLLLLDLRMPIKSGYDVLEWVQSQQSFKNMLVVVLAGSSLPEDYERCMELGAHAYYVKIPQRQARLDMVRSIETLLRLSREGATSPG
jgi:CheY-like chemotaxis protein